MAHNFSDACISSVQCSTQSASPAASVPFAIQHSEMVSNSNTQQEHCTSPTTAEGEPSSARRPSIALGSTSRGASDIYWARLQALLVEANTKLSSLRPSLLKPAISSGARSTVASLFQGLSPTAVEASLSTISDSSVASEYRILLETNAAGQFVDYGVQEAHVDWVMVSLQSVNLEHVPRNIDSVWTRVRVFEAEIACLPVDIVDELLSARKSMHKVRSRIDICVRILMAMEGRGRKMQPATLDKLKASLEKAELQSQFEARKLIDRERERQERKTPTTPISITGHGVSQTTGSCTPSSARKGNLDDKRRKEKAQQNAQASFMMRFVRSKTSDARDGPQNGFDRDDCNDDIAQPGNNESKRRRDGFYAANFPDDPDVMSAAWWLHSQVPSLGYIAVRCAIRDQASSTFSSFDLRECLQSSKRSRLSVRTNVCRAMRDFRRSRREHLGDRNPQLLRQRYNARCCCNGLPVKLLQFAENHRPAYYGTYRKRSSSVNGRRPFAKDNLLDYEHDSDEDWDDDDGEDLSDMEAELEQATEDAELRKLYGSDEEEDDDFLDDGEIEGADDADDEADDDEDRENVCVESADANRDVDRGNLEIQPAEKSVAKMTFHDVGESAVTVDDGAKRQASEGLKRAGKRRKLNARQNVVIEGPSPPLEVCNSELRRFPVTMVEGASAVPMFNPFVFDVAHLEAEHLKARVGASRGSRVAMDDRARKELAVVVEKGSKDGFTRDRIVNEFCSVLKASGLVTPSKNEIVRAIGDMATFEKRGGDTRAGWHLNNDALRLANEST